MAGRHVGQHLRTERAPSAGGRDGHPDREERELDGRDLDVEAQRGPDQERDRREGQRLGLDRQEHDAGDRGEGGDLDRQLDDQRALARALHEGDDQGAEDDGRGAVLGEELDRGVGRRLGAGAGDVLGGGGDDPAARRPRPAPARGRPGSSSCARRRPPCEISSAPDQRLRRVRAADESAAAQRDVVDRAGDERDGDQREQQDRPAARSAQPEQGDPDPDARPPQRERRGVPDAGHEEHADRQDGPEEQHLSTRAQGRGRSTQAPVKCRPIGACAGGVPGPTRAGLDRAPPRRGGGSRLGCGHAGLRAHRCVLPRRRVRSRPARVHRVRRRRRLGGAGPRPADAASHAAAAGARARLRGPARGHRSTCSVTAAPTARPTRSSTR